jgi:hypothetical protein
VAAHVQDGQGVVLIRNLRRRRIDGRQRLPIAARPLASSLVDQAQAGGPKQPAARVRRNPVTRPVLGCGEQRLLDGILRCIEIA